MQLFDLMCDRGVAGEGGRRRRRDDQTATCDVITGAEIATVANGKCRPIVHILSANTGIAIKRACSNNAYC